MEAVRKRPQRAKSAKNSPKQEEKLSISDDEETATLQAAIAELDAIQTPDTMDTEIQRNEEDLMALLQSSEGAKEQELLVAEGAGSQPPNNPNGDGGKSKEKDVQAAEQEDKRTDIAADGNDEGNDIGTGVEHEIKVATDVVLEGISAPSAPAFEEEHLSSVAAPEQLPLLPKPNAPPPPPPVRSSMPRAFHEITVPTGTDSAAPSAPPDLDDDDIVMDEHSTTMPSAPSLSPTASKKLHRVVASPRNPEKMNSVARMSGKETATATVEGASVAVHNSFAKSHQAEKKAGLHSIYPTMPQEATITADSTAPSTEGVADGAQASYEQLLKKKHIRVKLEPFVNYEMNLMRSEASQKRQEMKMRHIETNKGELYARIERYLFSEYILHNAASTMDEYKQKIDVLVKKVWTLEKKRVSSSKRCGDNVEIEQQMEFQTAKLETIQLEKLKAHLDKLRQLRTVEASMHTFDRAIAYFHVEQYLNSVLLEPILVAFLNKTSLSGGSVRGIDDLDLIPEGANFYEALPQGSSLASSVDHLKYCLDVLIFFEKKVTLGEEGVFGRVPQSFYRGELIWHSTHAKMHYSAAGGAGMERKIKCYACGSLNAPMKAYQWCKLCERCDVVLYLPPSSVSTRTNEWFTSVLRFRQSLQKWISTCMQSLLRTTSLQNMPYLLMHVMYLPRISTDERSWFLRFLQFPRAMVRADGSHRNEWSEDLVDHYIAMLHLVFHPEKLRRMSVIVSSGPLNSTIKTVGVGMTDSKGLVSPEWVLLENPEMLDRYFLSDEDFVAVLNQFPNTFAFEQLFRCSSDVKKCYSRALTLVLELTQSLRAFQEFEKLPTRIAQLLGQLLADAANLPGSSRPNEGGMNDAIFYPTLFDQLFLTSLHGLMAADCNRVAWKSLNLFPFGSLSELAKWDVLALLLFNLNNLPLEAKTASGWMQFIGKPTSQGVDTCALARQHLYDLIESDTESAMHLLNAVASLAASCRWGTSSGASHFGERNDLVSVAVHELFMAGYTVGSCQQALGENGERAAVPLSTICLAHPWVLSLLITLLFKYHECAATWIHVFETFPINRWMPTPQDLLNLQEWLLLEDTGAPRSALARFLLDHINWEYDVKQQRLFTDAMLHRQVALMVAEALVLYKTRQERASDPESAIVLSGGGSPQKLEVTSIAKSIRRALWLGETIDFEKWCWKLMLKLRFYSPKTHEPLLPLIDLRHDRSREALTLRRWFAGASVLRVLPSRKVFPFYTSREEQVSRFGDGDNDRRRVMGVGFGGSTGAPIQQEGRMLLTPHNPKALGGGDIESTVSATAAPRTEPIVAYVICQMTTFVFSDRLDRWEPLLVLLKSELFPAAIKVLDNLFPILSRLDKTKDFLSRPAPASTPQTESENESKTATSNSEDDGEAILSAGEAEIPAQSGGVMMEIDNELEVCMAAMHALTTDELLSLLKSLHEFSYINTDELHRMQEVLNKGYIGGWESTAKERILAKLRFVRECSRYLHPVVLPALINECFPQSSPVSVTTSALFHGAMSWISSALGGENTSGALSPSAASSTSAALSIRNSSLTATIASLAMIAGNEYSPSAKSLCALVQRSFEYSVDNLSLTGSMQFWVKALLQVPFWYENSAFRHVLDTVLNCSMESSYESNFVRSEVSAKATQGLSSDILYEVVGLLELAFDSFCKRAARREEDSRQPEQQFLENEPVIVMSFLPAVAASATFASIFGGSFDVAQYVSGCPHLALWNLLVETRKEVPLFLTMGQLMVKYEPKTMKKLEKMKKTEGRLAAALAAVRDGKILDDQAEEMIYESPSSTSRVGNPFVFGHTSLDSLSQYKIYRWCNYCLDLPESESTQILYWQVFFALYFATAGGSHVFGHHFLDRSGSRSAKRVHLRKHLQTKLRKLVNYCSNQAQIVLTATGGSGASASNGVGSAAELKERRYAHFVALSQLYTAMDAWLEEKDPNQWLIEEELTGLPRHYEVERLKDVLRLSDVLLNSDPDDKNWLSLPLWTNWCGFEFTVRRTTPQVTSSSEHATITQPLVPSLSTPLAAVGDEDDFAFVEEASELARRHSSFGGLVGLTALSIRPLPVVADLCGPASLTQLPTVSAVLSMERCAIMPSIPLNKVGLKTFAMKFSENLSVLVALDSEMVDSVSRLYSSKARTVTQSLACPEGTSCRSPAAFRFEFLEWMMDSRMDDAIQSIRTQGERCDMRSMVETNMMSSLSEHNQEGSATVSSTAPFAAEHFLQLDGDGFMLSVQILLIDQVVRTLDLEHQKLQRQKKTLGSEIPVDLIKDAGNGDDKNIEADNAPEREQLNPMEENEKQTERLHNKGLEWFRLLTELDTKLSRMVPPLREALWRSIKQLGLSFVCVDERETCTLLQLMLEDPSRINLLSDCFFPAAAPSRFVEMFAKLMSASSSSKLSSEEKLTLLRCFDFRAWLQTKPPQTPIKFDRDTVLCMILGDIAHQFPADRSLVVTSRKTKDSSTYRHLDEVLRVYANVLQLICSDHLEDHVEKLVHALVGVHDDYRFQTSTVGNGEPAPSADEDDESSASGLTALPRPVDGVVWQALVGIPLAAWEELPLMQIESCITFLSQHMTSLRWQCGLSSGGSLTTGGGLSSGSELLRGRQTSNVSSTSTAKYPIVYWQRLGVLKSFLDLFTLCCRVAPEQQQWGLIIAFFEPLLSTLYQPATNTEGSAISAPWSEQDTLSTGTTICSCFVATCSEYLKSPPSAGSQQRAVFASYSDETKLTQTTKLSQIWSFYLTVLVPHAPTHICKHFHQFVTRLAWEHWCLTLEIVQQMRELVQTEKQQLTRVAGNTEQIVPPLHSTLSPYPFVSWLVRDVLCRTTWKSTDAWLEAQSEAVCSSFLLEFAKLCLELVLDMPHFQVQSGHAASTNVLPPYFVNFIKQQSAFWMKWRMTMGDLETLKQFTLDALKEPLKSRASPINGASIAPAGPFPAVPSAAMMQDAFTRLQLVLRLFGQITTLHHGKIPKRESLQRVSLFLKLLFGVFEVNDRGGLDGNCYNSTYAAWLMVLYGSSCTALYEKLDEIVHFYKQDASKESGEGAKCIDESKEGVTEEDLTTAVSEVLRFCNLSVAEVFFKQLQNSPKAGSGGSVDSSSSASGSSSLNWNKCGNVVFVEIDALVRDFASSHKALQQRSYRGHQISSDRSPSKEEDASGTVISAIQSPAEAIGTPLGKVLWSFLAFRGGELACLAACGRALASVHVMSQVAEKSIEKWVIEERRGMWDALALRLQVPELSGEEFEAACLVQGKLMTLQVLFLQQLRRAPVLTESLSLALLTKLMGWMERARVGSSSLVQMKLLFLVAEMTNFVCKPLAEVLPSTLKKQMLRQLCDLLLELGHARRNNGIMKAIGLGGSLQYGIEFHVSCLAAGIFLRLQTRNGAPLRVDERIPFKMTRTTEKHLRALETMLQSKDAFQLGRRADALVNLARDARRSLADQDEFFVTLFSSMYPAQGWLLAKCLP